MNGDALFSPRWLAVWTGATIVFTLAPLVAVLLVSVTPLNYISLPTTGVSLRWYVRLVQNQDLLVSAWNSLVLGVAAAVAAILLGTSAAIASVRHRFALLQPLRLCATAPLFVPMVMSGLAILIFSARLGLQDPILRTFIAHAGLTLPYVFRTVTASLAGIDPNQELAAQNLGASPVRAFVHVVLPALGPGLAAGALFAFIASFDNVGVSIFLSGARFQLLPVQLFTYASYSSDPMVAAASVAMIAVSVAAILAVERFFGLQRLIRGS